MHGNTQKTLCPQQLPCNRNRQTIAAQMDADSFQRQCNIDPIIDEESGPARGCHGLHLTRKRHEFSGWEIAFTELNRRHPGCKSPLQKGNQWTPLGLMTICDEEKVEINAGHHFRLTSHA
jgi:hypothetical protein